MSASPFLAIQTTCRDRYALLGIAKVLVEKRLAACVQISGPVESVYVWDGKLETSEEWLLVAKTSQDLFQQVSAQIQLMHPYQVPEIVAVPILEMSQEYKTWMESCLKPVA